MGLAADRGVTICFADLDGADGLWVPEERTILVSRRLSEQRVNEVIEHELAHVAIDDQHAALDAGVWAKPGRTAPAWLARRWAAPALSLAAFVALIGGVTAGLAAARPDAADRGIVTPTLQPTAPTTEGGGPVPTTTVERYRDKDGVIRYRTVTRTPTASPSLPTGTAPTTRAGTTSAPPTRKGVSSGPPVPPQSTTSPAGGTPTPTVTPTPEPTTPVASPTSPVAATASTGGGQTG